jgi:hypothetical protein
LKSEIKATQQQMVEDNKNKCANALKEVKCFCKEFGFTDEVLKDLLYCWPMWA